MPRYRSYKGISVYALRQARAYSCRYNEWKSELNIEGLPEDRRTKLEADVQRVESTALSAVKGDMVLYDYMLRYVTEEHTSYNDLFVEGIPVSKNSFSKMSKDYYTSIVNEI